MAHFINIKLLIIMTALLASLVGYAAYNHHREAIIEQHRRDVFRPMSADEKRARPSGFAEALKRH